MIINKKLLLTAFLSLTLAACGGGGGSGGNSGVILAGGLIDPASCVLPVGTLAITAANAEVVASEVKSAIQTALAFANATSDLIILNNFFLPTNPATLACDTSGSFTTTLTGINPISMGDQLALEFSNCADAGTTLNGTFTATYDSITEIVVGEAGNISSANDWGFSISSVSDDLQVDDGNIDVAADGLMEVPVSFSASGVDLSVSPQSTGLTFADRGGRCASIDSVFISSTATNVTTNPASYILRINDSILPLVPPANIASTLIGGVVAVSTNVPISGMEDFFNVGLGEVDKHISELDDASPPTAGEIFIQSGMSSATIISMPGGVVQIAIDVDLDGMVDDTIMTTWAAL